MAGNLFGAVCEIDDTGSRTMQRANVHGESLIIRLPAVNFVPNLFLAPSRAPDSSITGFRRGARGLRPHGRAGGAPLRHPIVFAGLPA
ncbi:MAG: hypothetical protein L0Y39_08865 [Methylococcaceae bacterium]|nr:hypothetical protein [Methylococcaceae bacterium]